jgi:hypothetical protein
VPDDRSPSVQPVASAPTMPTAPAVGGGQATRAIEGTPNAEIASEMTSNARDTTDATQIADTAPDTVKVDHDGGAEASDGSRDETSAIEADPVPSWQASSAQMDSRHQSDDARVTSITDDETSSSVDQTPSDPKSQPSVTTTSSSAPTRHREHDALREADVDHSLGSEPSASGATTRRDATGDKLDRAATEHLRSLIQAQWLDRFVLAFDQRNLRTWIRDTRLVVIDAGEIGIVLDHETRRKKLEPYVDDIVATMRQLYGANIQVRMLLESETDDAGPTEAPEVEEPEEMLIEPDDVSTPPQSTQRFSEDAIVANVTDVFPGARLIQGEL